MLKLRRIAIDTYNENVALIARNCSEFRPAEYQAFKKLFEYIGDKIGLRLDIAATDGSQPIADFTYIWTAEGWLYVVVMLDLLSRRRSRPLSASRAWS